MRAILGKENKPRLPFCFHKARGDAMTQRGGEIIR